MATLRCKILIPSFPCIAPDFAIWQPRVKDLPALVFFADGHVAETFAGDVYRQHAAVAWVKKLLNLEDSSYDDEDD